MLLMTALSPMTLGTLAVPLLVELRFQNLVRERLGDKLIRRSLGFRRDARCLRLCLRIGDSYLLSASAFAIAVLFSISC